VDPGIHRVVCPIKVAEGRKGLTLAVTVRSATQGPVTAMYEHRSTS
jgi:hypothetical protein